MIVESGRIMINLPTVKTNIRWGDWLSAILLIVIMQIATARLVATLWPKDLHIVQIITLLGTLIGLALGKSVFNRFWTNIFTIAYVVCLIPWQIGLTLDSEIKWNDSLGN